MLKSIGKYFEKLKAKLFPVEEQPVVYVQQTDEQKTFYIDAGAMAKSEVDKVLSNIQEDAKPSPFDVAQEFVKSEPVNCKGKCTCKSKKTKTTGKGKPRRSRSNRGRGQRTAKAGTKR